MLPTKPHFPEATSYINAASRFAVFSILLLKLQMLIKQLFYNLFLKLCMFIKNFFLQN